MPFSDTAVFKLCTHQAFKKVDKDSSGTLSKTELTIALCHLHYKLLQNTPGITDPPSEAEVTKLLQDNDLDSSGTLSEDEFQKLAAQWFDRDGGKVVRRILLTTFLGMVVLPESASWLHRQMPFRRFVPRILFKVAFGVLFKLAATNWPRAD